MSCASFKIVSGAPSGARNPIAVDLSRLHTGHEGVPIVARSVYGRIEGNNALWSSIILTVKEEQLDARGASREEAEIRATLSNR
jgi:hypothetical protein